MKYIRSFISKLTRPDGLRVCPEVGDYWVVSNYYHDYPHSYQKVTQGFWGNWKVESCWRGMWESLPLDDKEEK